MSFLLHSNVTHMIDCRRMIGKKRAEKVNFFVSCRNILTSRNGTGDLINNDDGDDNDNDKKN